MPTVCLYLQLHQPYRLRELDFFEIGAIRQQSSGYFATVTQDDNGAIFQKVAHKSYSPMLSLLAEALEQNPTFCFALSVSGVFLEQALAYEPVVIEQLRQLAATNRVEFLAETYHHSLASLYSPAEFATQVRLHAELLQKLFGLTPTVFRNTELIYSNEVGQLVAELGYQGMLTEAVPRYLGARKKTELYLGAGAHHLPLLLKHAEFSDDIAFRFSSSAWPEYPLTAEKYSSWLAQYPQEAYINLFMDFETFGEHQWESTGIFEFFTHFLSHFSSQKYNDFMTPSQIFSREKPTQVYDVPDPISWADIDRDLTAWRGNSLQEDSLRKIYDLADAVLQSGDEELIEDWRKLQTSDHFYYMCAKWAADGDVHAYFSPYDSPYEAYRRYSIALADLADRVLPRQPLPSP